MHAFNILKKLGEGTFGCAYLCEKKHNKLQVVVKEMNANLNKEQLQMIKNEVSIIKQLNNPNIVQYQDSFLSGGRFCIVMEYATKGTLYEKIKESIPNHIPQQEVVNYFTQIVGGLHHIHSKNIIHRDLKSENIFLTGVRGDVVKIGDFGISRILNDGGKASTIVGTTNYLAPELCQNRPYNSKCDIWSLGCVTYELCALRRLFEGPIGNVVLSIMSDTASKTLINTEHYSPELQYVIQICLSYEPENRPDTRQLFQLPIMCTYFQLCSTLGCISANKQT